MPGHGSTPPPDRGSHPGRKVGRTSAEVMAANPPLTQQQRDTRHLWDEDWAAEGRALNAEPREDY